MNLSLRNRVFFSFICANIAVGVLSFLIFHYLDSLNRNIESITVKTNRVSLRTDEVRISAVSILKYQRRILSNNGNPELVAKLMDLCESFTSQLQSLQSLYENTEVIQVIDRMIAYVDSLKVVLSKASVYNRDDIGMSSIGDLADKILDTFSEFQDLQYTQGIERDKKIEQIISETKRTMMITLIIAFLAIIILNLMLPGKIALPFKKIKDAIRELQDCNFDVSIYYTEDDEIGEIAREMNKMIHSFKVFEELRTDRINLENRKFDVLANMVKRPVLISNAEGELIYMNNQMYSLLQVQSEDVIGKTMVDTVIPESIIESYQLAIKRRSKIENAEVNIVKKAEDILDKDEKSGPQLDIVEDEKPEGDTEVIPKEEVIEYVFQGYASVIPIRGKESSLDYYLMVLSKEVYV